MDRNELRDKINRILFHVLSNEERADKIAELIAPELEKAEKWDRIGHHVHGLAMLVLQSPFYHDFDVKEVVDIILAETLPKISEVPDGN